MATPSAALGPRLTFRAGRPEWDAACFVRIRDTDPDLWASTTAMYPRLLPPDPGRPPGVHPLPGNTEDEGDRIRRAASELHRERRARIASAVVAMRAIWEPVGREWLPVLAEILETGWGPRPTGLTAFVGLSPLCPRDLAGHHFTLPYYLPENEVVRISAHEIAHFLYARVVRLALPSVPPERLDYPHREWLLSEILVPIILNDPRSVKVIGASRLTSYVCRPELSHRLARLYASRSRCRRGFASFLAHVSTQPIPVSEVAPPFRFILGRNRPRLPADPEREAVHV